MSYILPLAIVLLATTACLGPKPVVDGYTVTPPAPVPNGPYRIDTTITNSGPGSGQVEVQVNLTDKKSGIVLRQDSVDVDMQAGETQHVLFDITLPPSAQSLNPGDIDVQVQAKYPIE